VTHEYSAQFFDYTHRTALRSAQVIVPFIVDALRCRSVLDVGCGTGAWLSVYRECGAEDVSGIDDDYVDRTRLLIAPDRYQAVDLAHAFDLGRSFDLVQSLEVAEHIPTAASETMVANLCRHGDRVLFSAASPGQGGEHHINEQPFEFWRRLFAAQGFSAYDFVRPRVRGATTVGTWYAHNTVLYIRDSAAPSLPDVVRQSRVADDAPIPNVAPALFRLRAALLRPLPVAVVSALSIWHRRWLARA
jgi:SAM-dependent methyltransferase